MLRVLRHQVVCIHRNLTTRRGICSTVLPLRLRGAVSSQNQTCYGVERIKLHIEKKRRKTRSLPIDPVWCSGLALMSSHTDVGHLLQHYFSSFLQHIHSVSLKSLIFTLCLASEWLVWLRLVPAVFGAGHGSPPHKVGSSQRRASPSYRP